MSAELIYNLVYDYYETRIAMGVYRCGDILPSIPKIAEGFQMAPLTVRSALTRLEKKGYIRIISRKPAEVIYLSLIHIFPFMHFRYIVSVIVSCYNFINANTVQIYIN